MLLLFLAAAIQAVPDLHQLMAFRILEVEWTEQQWMNRFWFRHWGYVSKLAHVGVPFQVFGLQWCERSKNRRGSAVHGFMAP